jgi:hypothetical protein
LVLKLDSVIFNRSSLGKGSEFVNSFADGGGVIESLTKAGSEGYPIRRVDAMVIAGDDWGSPLQGATFQGFVGGSDLLAGVLVETWLKAKGELAFTEECLELGRIAIELVDLEVDLWVVF